MSTIVCSLQGRFGNQCGQFLFAYGYAQRHGLEFRCPEWLGERVFALPEYKRPDDRRLERYNEAQLLEHWQMGERPNTAPGCDIEFRGYAQTQFCADHYTKRQAQEWLKFRPEVEAVCSQLRPYDDTIICHLRRGDYLDYGYVGVSLDSYRNAMNHFGLHPLAARFLSEENPTPHGSLPADLSFAPDFYRMVHAHTLLRANSTFSWLAGLLGNGLVLAPIIEGLAGGREQHCKFAPGNWPRFANLDFISDMHVAP